MRAIVSYVNYHFYSLAFLFADKLYLEHNVFWINVIYVCCCCCCFCAFLNVRIKRVSVNQSVDFWETAFIFSNFSVPDKQTKRHANKQTDTMAETDRHQTVGRRKRQNYTWSPSKPVFSSLIPVAFSALARILEKNVKPFTLRLCFFFFFFEVEISSHTLISLFIPESVHSGSASWDDYGRMFPDKLRVSSLPDRFPHYAWTAA